MQTGRVFVCSLAALFCSFALSFGADAQYRDRNRDSQAIPQDTDKQIDRGRPQRRGVPDSRRNQRGSPAPRYQAQPQEQRRAYDRRPEREWHRDRPAANRPVFIPRRWSHNVQPHRRNLSQRRYSRVWWCGTDCRIALLFGFTVWAVDTTLSHASDFSFPIWEALEYSPTGEVSLWESGWGYVEFTPTRTFRTKIGRYTRDCRDFLRVVVRNDGVERRYNGTACRNPRGTWWVVS